MNRVTVFGRYIPIVRQSDGLREWRKIAMDPEGAKPNYLDMKCGLSFPFRGGRWEGRLAGFVEGKMDQFVLYADSFS